MKRDFTEAIPVFMSPDFALTLPLEKKQCRCQLYDHWFTLKNSDSVKIKKLLYLWLASQYRTIDYKVKKMHVAEIRSNQLDVLFGDFWGRTTHFVTL